jgi:hypothetical protein
MIIKQEVVVHSFDRRNNNAEVDQLLGFNNAIEATVHVGQRTHCEDQLQIDLAQILNNHMEG